MTYNYSMGKRTQRNTPRHPRNKPSPRISHQQCRTLIRDRLADGRQTTRHNHPNAHKLRAVLHSETLECPICLQTLLWPVLAECGHLFCLPCAEDLSRHDFGCGMCRNFEPCFQPRVDSRFRQLVALWLRRCPREERLIYRQRLKALQVKENDRTAGTLAVGDAVDLWSIEGKCWLVAIVGDITEDGHLVLSEPKGHKSITVEVGSRRVARHRCFTREENSIVADEGMEVNAFGERRSMFGMPMFFNFFGGDASAAFNMDINDLLGLVPFRPFPF